MSLINFDYHNAEKLTINKNLFKLPKLSPLDRFTVLEHDLDARIN